jgi:hypothetical protein
MINKKYFISKKKIGNALFLSICSHSRVIPETDKDTDKFGNALF